MKLVYGVLIALIGNPVIAADETESIDVIQSLIQSTSGYLTESICSGNSSMSKTASCYMTPSGKRVYELPEGVERSYWTKIGNDEHRRYLAEQKQRREQYEEQAEQRYKQAIVDRDLCQFWQDQAPSPRQAEKQSMYCK